MAPDMDELGLSEAAGSDARSHTGSLVDGQGTGRRSVSAPGDPPLEVWFRTEENEATAPSLETTFHSLLYESREDVEEEGFSGGSLVGGGRGISQRDQSGEGSGSVTLFDAKLEQLVQLGRFEDDEDDEEEEEEDSDDSEGDEDEGFGDGDLGVLEGGPGARLM